MADLKIAVIGSGLAAVAACKALIARGVKPVVLDVGELIDAQRASVVERMSQLQPAQWAVEDRDLITRNCTIRGDRFPQKLAFGSDYFYGRSSHFAPIENIGGNESCPPFSYAQGGFSVGWGAAVLPPDDCDLLDWPIANRELRKYYADVLYGLPYSAATDSLTVNFPLLREPSGVIQMTRGNRVLLRDLELSGLFAPNKLVFGQARLLANPDSLDGCKYCGCCMSGCVYGAIYKTNRDIKQMSESKLIDYRSGMIVHSLEEQDGVVKVLVDKAQGCRETLRFDRVFVAAGTLNSTRIVLQSKKLYDQKVEIKTTVAFVAPMLRFRPLPLDWPDCNTLPGIFLAYKVDRLSDHWVHTQLSTPNELVLERLGIAFRSSGLMGYLKQRLARHLAIAVCNLHSDHANSYEIVLKRGQGNDADKIISTRRSAEGAIRAIKLASQKLLHIGHKIRCYPIIPAIKNTTRQGGYHVGGSLPMRLSPEKETETDCLGRPKGWRRIHIVDSSVFPSLPGTTIGLLAMANSARIASETEL